MAARIRLTKHHGLGNDFLVALTSRTPGVESIASAAVARRWCDRHRGIGADGLIVGIDDGPGDADASGVASDVAMRLFNADGSEAEISGNGIRCLAQAWSLAHERPEIEGLRIRTAGGMRLLDLRTTTDPAVADVTVDMGAVSPGPEAPPSLCAIADEHVGSGSVGNPHVVVQVARAAQLDALDVAGLGAPADAAVPGGANIHFMVVEDRGAIRLRHWERGAGITDACGSGATVAAVLAHRWGLVDDRVRVDMPGGAAVVEVGATKRLIGPSAHVADIEVTA